MGKYFILNVGHSLKVLVFYDFASATPGLYTRAVSPPVCVVAITKEYSGRFEVNPKFRPNFF